MAWQRARRPEQRNERVSAILDAAAELYETHEFDDVHMAMIAERAGLGKASLYEYFSTKGELFLAIALRDVERWAGDVESRLNRMRSPNAERIASAVTNALRGQARLLRLRLTVQGILQRAPATDAIAEFNRSFMGSMQRVVIALQTTCPQLTPKEVTEFWIQHQALNAGLWAMLQGAEELDRANCSPSEIEVPSDLFVLFERTMYQILRCLLEDARKRKN